LEKEEKENRISISSTDNESFTPAEKLRKIALLAGIERFSKGLLLQEHSSCIIAMIAVKKIETALAETTFQHWCWCWVSYVRCIVLNPNV
jgi:hypothetical protein